MTSGRAAILVLALLAGCGGGGGDGSHQGSLALEVAAPRDGAVVTVPTIVVRGRVTPGADVTVNGAGATERAGAFRLRVDTKPGLNTLTVAASKEGYEPASREISLRRPTPPAEAQKESPAVKRSAGLRFFFEQTFGGALEPNTETSWFRFVDLNRTFLGRDGSITVATKLGRGEAGARRQARLICRAARGFESPKHAGKVEVVAADGARLARC